MNMEIKKMIGDGNCLFRCFAFHHYGYERFHKKVRSEIVIYVIQNRVDFESFIVGDPSYGKIISCAEEYASHMSTLGNLGGAPKLRV